MNGWFGSNYLSESRVSTVKILKSKYKSPLTDEHLNCCIRLAIAKYTPNYNKLSGDAVSGIALNSIAMF
jgi:hypothetical protein